MTAAKIFSNLLWINTVLAIVIIVMERRNTRSTWLWIMIMVLLPGAGFFLYLWLGRDFNKRKMFESKGIKDLGTNKGHLDANEDFLLSYNAAMAERNYLGRYESLFQMLYLNSQSKLTFNNEIQTVFEGQELFDQLFEDIRNAKEYIYIQTYIMRADKIGQELIDLLIERAQDGLDVKLLADGMGARTFWKRHVKRARAGGVQVEFFFPFFISFISPRINYRNHRKNYVIDGKIGYVGGYNIGDEYITGGRKFDGWRDSAIRVTGDAVQKFQYRFELDFSFAAGKEVQYKKPIRNPEASGKIPMQIVSAGPDSIWPSVKDGMLKMISLAEKTIYIETPYFIPDDSVLEGLRVASLSGVDIRVMLPYKGDHPFIYWANLSYVGDLLKAGVKFYFYEKGFQHSKVMIIDDEILTVGTSNMDERSFHLNFEINAFVYDKETALKFSNKFLTDIEENSSEITKEIYDKRSKFVKVKENFSRLLSPLL